MLRDGSAVPLTPGRDTVPLTSGRDTEFDTRWNAWTEVTGTDTSDRRYGLDTRNRFGTATTGLDYKLTEDVVIGASVGLQRGNTHGFRDLMQSETNGVTFGPYFAVRLSPNWAADLSLTYTQSNSDLRIVALDGSSTQRNFAASFSLHAQYTVAEWFIRPKLTVNYANNRSDARTMQGTFLGLPLSFVLPESSSNSGSLEGFTEFSRLFDFGNGFAVIPYAEFGLRYEFERPGGGAILAGDLSNVIPAPWTGTARSGVRMQFPNAMLVDANIAYLSLGHSGLDVWEGKFRISFGF